MYAGRDEFRSVYTMRCVYLNCVFFLSENGNWKNVEWKWARMPWKWWSERENMQWRYMRKGGQFQRIKCASLPFRSQRYRFIIVFFHIFLIRIFCAQTEHKIDVLLKQIPFILHYHPICFRLFNFIGRKSEWYFHSQRFVSYEMKWNEYELYVHSICLLRNR